MFSMQSGILEEISPLARCLSFTIGNTTEIKQVLTALADKTANANIVIGIGPSLVEALGGSIPALRVFPAQCGGGINLPSTPTDLWIWLRGDDRGELYHRSLDIEKSLAPAFDLCDVVDTFRYDDNRDLSGYEDGTENPEGDEAIDAAAVRDQGAGLDGSSFVAVLQWLHDFDALNAMTTEQRDDVIGRRISDNEEFDEAPESAHVKRTAQESFEPEAFILRRSMPWAEGTEAGLLFVAFGKSFDSFEAILNRMLGKEDGISDALFSFTRPISGAYYWCPPLKDGKLDLSALAL